jgi:hypothetical protein
MRRERNVALNFRRRIGLAALALALGAILGAAPRDAMSGGVTTVAFVAPGMNRTELQSVLGPPDYIQVKNRREAWQYCPRPFFIRFLDRFFRDDKELFVTVWFNEGRVEHMRAYPGHTMGRCEDYFAAFSWEDEIVDVPMAGGYGEPYPIK